MNALDVDKPRGCNPWAYSEVARVAGIATAARSVKCSGASRPATTEHHPPRAAYRAAVQETNPMKRPAPILLSATAMLVLLASGSPAQAADDDATRDIVVGKYATKAPEGFTRQQPRSKIIAYEFSVAPAEGDEQPGRLTIMSAGGTIDANLDRWYAQFSQPDGNSTRDRSRKSRSPGTTSVL